MPGIVPMDDVSSDGVTIVVEITPLPVDGGGGVGLAPTGMPGLALILVAGVLLLSLGARLTMFTGARAPIPRRGRASHRPTIVSDAAALHEGVEHGRGGPVVGGPSEGVAAEGEWEDVEATASPSGIVHYVFTRTGYQ